MKSINDYLNSSSKYSDYIYEGAVDLVGLEESLKDSLVGNSYNIDIAGLVLPQKYLTSSFIGSIIEFIIVNDITSVSDGTSKMVKFSIGKTEDSVAYDHPDLMINGVLAEIKASRNLAKDGIKFTPEQQKTFTDSTIIIWVGYSISGNSIVINDVKVRTYGELPNKSRVYKL